MQFNPNSPVLALDGNPAIYEGVTPTLGEVLSQSIRNTKGSPEVKECLWATAKIIFSALERKEMVSVPDEATAKVIKKTIWHHDHFPLDILGCAHDQLEAQLAQNYPPV